MANIKEVEKRKKYIPAKIIIHMTPPNLFIKIIDKPVRVRTHTGEESPEKSIIIQTKSFQETGRCYPKRYLSTCYFQPKKHVVSYSETVLVTLGSDKMKYYDTVVYQTNLIPFRWTETVKTLIPALNENLYQTHYETYMEKPEHHLISLQPQQLTALEQQITIAV